MRPHVPRLDRRSGRRAWSRPLLTVLAAMTVVAVGAGTSMFPPTFSSDARVGVESHPLPNERMVAQVAPVHPDREHSGVTWPDQVTIPVGVLPYALAVDPLNGDIYVGNSGSNDVTVISGWTDTVIATLNVGQDPQGLVVDAQNGNVYVANSGSSTVTVISGSTNTVVATIPVGDHPGALAVDSQNGNIYVANYGSATVSVISGTSNTVVATVPVGSAPGALAVDSRYGGVYVISEAVSVINGTTNSVVATVPVGDNPVDLAVDESSGFVYVANAGFESNPGDTVTVIADKNNSVVATITVASAPQVLAVDPASGIVWVASFVEPYSAGTVSAISGITNTVVGTTYAGPDPDALAIDPASNLVYASNDNPGANGTVTEISGSTYADVATYPIPEPGLNAVFDAATGSVYVADGVSPPITGDVSVLSTPTPPFEDNFTVGAVFNGSCQPVSVTANFTGSASGGVLPYLRFMWSFGSFHPLSFGPKVSETFNSTGTFNVTLSVLDSAGETAYVTHPVTILPPPACAPPRPLGSASPQSWGAFFVVLGAAAAGFFVMAALVWKRSR